MVKRVNFGSVSLILFVSLLFISPQVTGEELELTQAYQLLRDKRDQCSHLAVSGHESLPRSKWLSGMNSSDKEATLLYLVISSFDRCIEFEVEYFQTVLAKQNKDVQTIIGNYVVIRPYIIPQYPDGVDKKKLDKLNSQIKSPFSMSEALKVYE